MGTITFDKEKFLNAYKDFCEAEDSDDFLTFGSMMSVCLASAVENEAEMQELLEGFFDIYSSLEPKDPEKGAPMVHHTSDGKKIETHVIGALDSSFFTGTFDGPNIADAIKSQLEDKYKDWMVFVEEKQVSIKRIAE
jgi:hypothetical protein